jgi:hypothetical protein
MGGYGDVQGIRLTRRDRVVLIGAVVAAVIGVLMAGFWLSERQGVVALRDVAASTSTAGERVTVGKGDTLWAIATRRRPSVDPRITVRQIMDVNGLPDPVVQPGQRLWLPAD